jgi:hypothetical protein
MAGAAGIAIVTGGGYRPVHARVEKARQTSDLRNEQRRHDDEKSRDYRHVRHNAVSQSETPAHEPLWSGPELNAAFVAQLLGQLMKAPAIASAQAPYRKAVGGPVSLVFDAAV